MKFFFRTLDSKKILTIKYSYFLWAKYWILKFAFAEPVAKAAPAKKEESSSDDSSDSDDEEEKTPAPGTYFFLYFHKKKVFSKKFLFII